VSLIPYHAVVQSIQLARCTVRCCHNEYLSPFAQYSRYLLQLHSANPLVHPKVVPPCLELRSKAAHNAVRSAIDAVRRQGRFPSRTKLLKHPHQLSLIFQVLPFSKNIRSMSWSLHPPPIPFKSYTSILTIDICVDCRSRT